MSFVGKFVSKVFKKAVKVVKRVIKSDWFKYAVLIGATLFVAGLGAGGFSQFWANATGGGLPGFFSAVGNTISTGFTTITSSIGKFFTGGSAGGPAATTPFDFSGPPVPGAPRVAEGAGKSLLGRVGSAFTSNTLGGDFLRGAVVAGFNAYAENERLKDTQRRADEASVYGGPARGGNAILHPGTIRKPILPGSGETKARQFANTSPPDPQELLSTSPQAGSGLLAENQATDIASLPTVQQTLDNNRGILA